MTGSSKENFFLIAWNELLEQRPVLQIWELCYCPEKTTDEIIADYVSKRGEELYRKSGDARIERQKYDREKKLKDEEEWKRFFASDDRPTIGKSVVVKFNGAVSHHD